MLVYTRDELHALFEDLKLVAEQPAKVAKADPDPPALAVGEHHDHELSDEITMRFRRTEEDIYTTTVIYRPTGDEVLERADGDDGSVDLLSLDPYFWTFSLNGRPATEIALEKAISERHAFRVDPEKREIDFKSDAV